MIVRRALALGSLLLVAGCAGGPRSQGAVPSPAAVDSAPSVLWVDRFGGRGRDTPRAVAMAADGSVYSVGQLAHDRQAGERSWTGEAARERMFLARHARDGKREWLLRFGGSPVDEPRALAVMPDGTVVIGGLFTGELAFGATSGIQPLRSIGSADAFLVGVDGEGSPRWAMSWGGKYADAVRALAVDKAGNIVVAGTFQLTADFDPGPPQHVMTSAGRTDAFVLELDLSRRLVWAQRFGGPGAEEVTGLALAADGDVYFGGSFEGRAPPETGGGLFLAALASDGTDRWMLSFDAGGTLSLTALAAGAGGAVYAGGTFQGGLRFEGRPVLGDGADRGAFAAMLDDGGELVWIRELGVEGASALTLSALTVTAEGLLLGGSFRGHVDFDPGPARAMLTAEATTGFVAALDAGGRLAWAAAPAAAGLGAALGIAAGAGGEGVVLGLARPRREAHAGEVAPDVEPEVEPEGDREGEEEAEAGSEVMVLGFRPPSHRGAEVENP